MFEAFAYPVRVSDNNDPDGDGWFCIGLGEPNSIPRPVEPSHILVGRPSDEEVALILPTNHTVELQFPGTLHDGTGADLLVVGAGVESVAEVLVVSETTEPVCLAACRSQPHPSGLRMLTYDFASLPELVRPAAVRIRGVGSMDPNGRFRLLRVRARTEPSEPTDLGT